MLVGSYLSPPQRPLLFYRANSARSMGRGAHAEGCSSLLPRGAGVATEAEARGRKNGDRFPVTRTPKAPACIGVRENWLPWKNFKAFDSLNTISGSLGQDFDRFP